jgi:hypothetical protein
MGDLSRVRRRLEEATAKRQGQVLPTENESWGFYGTIDSIRRERDPDGKGMSVDDAWRVAFGAVMKLFPGIPSKSIREFLDSKDGRHFADLLTFHLDQHPLDARKLEKAVRGAFGSAQGNYYKKALATLAGVPEPEAAHGTTAALVGQMKAVNDAWETVRVQEVKKNWKESEAAMRALEKAAEALVTGVRAWVSSSGRTPTYPGRDADGNAIRMTVPK